MALHLSYLTVKAFRPINDIVPGNQESSDPVEFDLLPAWGGDKARIKSLMFGVLGILGDSWTDEMQQSVIAALDKGASEVFVRTVAAVRGLTIPAIMALRAGILTKADDPDAKVAIRTGSDFSKIAQAIPGMAFHVAMEINKISDETQQDPRFFGQPSGSGGPATSANKITNAKGARRRSRRREIVASGSTQPGGQP